MSDRIFFTGLAILWLSAAGLIGSFIYIRAYIVDGAFDPWREYSLDMLWGACFLFLTSAAWARLASLCLPRRG